MVGKRGSKWWARAYDPETGGQRWLGTFATKKDAQAAERKAEEHKARSGGVRDETCDSFARRFPRDYPRAAGTTNSYYAQMLKAFARDFEGRRLRDVTPMEARAWVLGGVVPDPVRKYAAKWKDTRMEDGELVAPAHLSHHKPVRAAFSAAKNDDLVDRNPFAGLRIDRSPGRKDTIPFRTDRIDEAVRELARLVRCSEEVHWEASYGALVYGPLIVAAAYTGMRPGELFALRWENVDLDAGRVRVVEAVRADGTLARPKGDRERKIVLPPPAADALAKVPRTNGDLVFWTKRDGSRFTQRTAHYYWHPVRAAFGLPKMDFYELRHFCGSYLAHLGVDARGIALQLGHRDGGRLAQELYIHTYAESELERISTLVAAGDMTGGQRAVR